MSPGWQERQGTADWGVAVANPSGTAPGFGRLFPVRRAGCAGRARVAAW